MRKIPFDIQRFADATAVSGKKIVYLYRVMSEQETQDGTMLAFVTENGNSISNDAESTVTKDGTIRTPGSPEIEITSTSIVKKGDPLYKRLRSACLDGELVECWEANLEEPAETANKFAGTYYQGYLTEFEGTSNADGNYEVSITFGANGKGADGDVTVTDDQIQQAELVFTDTPKTGV